MLRGPVYAIQFFGFAIVGFEIIVGNSTNAGPRRRTPDVYAYYRIPGPPRRQAEEITTLQDEYAEVALRETIGQRGAAESGADHYRIITLRSRRNHQ